MEAPEKIYMPKELLSEEWTRHIEGEDVIEYDTYYEQFIIPSGYQLDCKVISWSYI